MSDNYQELLKSSKDKFEKQIFSLLRDNKLMIPNSELVHNSFSKTLNRIELQKQSIQSKIMILDKHMTDGKKFENFDNASMFDLVCMLAQTCLSYFEIFKECLRYCIDLKKIGVTEEQVTYDQVVDQLGDYRKDECLVFHKDGLRKFFNVNLRNSLVHDSWWLNPNAEFTLEEFDGTEISLNIGELYAEMANINAIVVSFTENYLQIFDKNMLDQLKHQNPIFFDCIKE